jgi:hypothetical protein
MRGDAIKKLTNAIGIQPCEMCEKRAQALNSWSRRGFIAGIAAAVVTGRLSASDVLLSAADGDNPTPQDALDLMRVFNTIQAEFKAGFVGKSKDYVDKREMLGPEGLLRHIGHALKEPATRKAALMKKVHPETDNIMAGWELDFFRTVSGYIIVLYEKFDASSPQARRNVFTTDDRAIIFRGIVVGFKQPVAASLSKADDSPGVVPWNDFDETQLLSNARVRLRHGLRRVTFTITESPCAWPFTTKRQT